jgi:MFS family permease
VFTIIRAHIVGMYGLVLVVGDLIDRIGRHRALVAGLVLEALSNAVLAAFGGMAGMSLALFGLGLGWSLSYVAASTELVTLARPAERGRLIGLSDLLASLAGAALALGGGVLYTATGPMPLGFATAALALVPAVWIGFRPPPARAPALQTADS